MSSWKKEYPNIVIVNDRGDTYNINIDSGVITNANGKTVRTIVALGSAVSYNVSPAYVIARLFAVNMHFCRSDEDYTRYKTALRKLTDTLSSIYDVGEVQYFITRGKAIHLLSENISADFILSKFPKAYRKAKNNQHNSDYSFWSEICEEIETEYYKKQLNFTTEEYEIYTNLYGSQKQKFTDKKFRTLYHRNMNNPKLIDFLGDCALRDKTFEYAKYCDNLEWEYESGNFVENFVKAKRTYEAKRDEIESKCFQKVQSKLRPFEDDEYTIVIPTTRTECINEGTALHNCIGTIEWENYLSQGKRCIVFIREKSNPDTPFFAADFTTDFSVCRQVRGNHNRCDTYVSIFADKYRKYMLSLL